MSTDNNIQSVLNKQRIDKFRLVLTLPEVLRDLNSGNWSITSEDIVNRDSLQFSLYSATMPEVSIPSKHLPVYAQTVKVTSQVREPYAPVTCNFTIDNRFRNYFILWKWLEFINNPRDSGMDDSLAINDSVLTKGQISTASANFLGYQTVISIFPLDEYNNTMCEFLFYNAFITKLSGFSFNFQDPTQIDCSFTFDFSQMDVKIIN